MCCGRCGSPKPPHCVCQQHTLRLLPGAVFTTCALLLQGWLADEQKLRQRLRSAAAINLVLAPFLLMFLVIYFFMKHAERFYHSPGTTRGLVFVS